MQITNSEFKENIADSGGGIHFTSISPILDLFSSFENNEVRIIDIKLIKGLIYGDNYSSYPTSIIPLLDDNERRNLNSELDFETEGHSLIIRNVQSGGVVNLPIFAVMDQNQQIVFTDSER